MLSIRFQYMLSLFGFIDIHVFTRFSGFVPTSDFSIKLTGQFMYPNVWITSLDHVHVWLPVHVIWLHLTYSLGSFLTPLDLHVQILDLGSCWDPRCWSEWRSWRVDQWWTIWSLFSQAPCSALEFSCYDSEPPFVQFIIVYLFVFSHLRHVGDVTFM